MPNIFCLSPSLSLLSPSAPSQSSCITDQGGEQLQKQRSLSASSSAHSSRRDWSGGRLYRVGVVPARPTQLPTGLPSNGERYLERRRRGRRERERAESAAAALLAPPSSPAQKAPSHTSKKQDRWIEQFADNFEFSTERLPETTIISVVNKHLYVLH